MARDMLSCDQERLKNNVTCTIQKTHDTSVMYAYCHLCMLLASSNKKLDVKNQNFERPKMLNFITRL